MRYLIVEKDRGIFLGSFKSISLFAKGNIFGITKAPSFEKEEDAEYYIGYHLPKEERQYGIIEIKSDEKYISIIDIIKQGYGEYTHDLIEFLPMQSESIH